MMQQADTLSNATTSTAATAVKAHRGGFRSPEQILRSLPATATPWQQDSALRANYKYQKIDWASRPNPLRTPTTQADPTINGALSKPMYYSRSLVQPDSIYRPEYTSNRPGVAGDPVPYTIAGDSLTTSILLACFILATIAIAKSGNFLQRQPEELLPRAARRHYRHHRDQRRTALPVLPRGTNLPARCHHRVFLLTVVRR